MILHELFDTQNVTDVNYLVERIEAEIMMELFGGLGGVARAGVNKMQQMGQAGMNNLRQAGQTMRNNYNDGEINSLLNQLSKYKDQLRNVIQNNPHVFKPQQNVMQARPAAQPQPYQGQQQPTGNPARDRYNQQQQAERGYNRPQPTTNNLSSLRSAEQRAGTVQPARRRVSSLGNAGMVSNFKAPGISPPQQPTRKPHIRMRARNNPYEGVEAYDEIITELFGGLSGVARRVARGVSGGIARAGSAIGQAGRSIGGSYAKGEAQAIIKKMLTIVNALKERGYQLPPDWATEIQQFQRTVPVL